ncbi:hypothetical protein Maq22A_1p34615 (plasmid) [Methylobacterium aquaticum]|uniref:Initiator Rep protein domain-containing protein n=1 Tax=Methylobacterium aquaticum TaxID=270351 RepID=A0A0C6F8R8_9HYPH|nr:hypothetical protein Maq22A_1p34615 [Methylobacterium aquaticum]
MPATASTQPRRRALFTPRVRGDLPAALQDAAAFVTVAPAVPRPATYLLSPELLAWAPEATARDLALWETLLTLAQGPDGSVRDLDVSHTANVRQALAALSAGGRQAQPRELVDSLHRLFGRERSPLRMKDAFDYRLPDFIGNVLVPGRYGHLDLVTLARFRHRAAVLLYRRIVGELAAAKARFVAGGVPHRIELKPIELAAAMGLSDVRVGQLKAAYLAPALGEIAEHVRAFRVVAEEVHGEKRPGQLHAPLERVTLAVEFLPPERLDAVPVRRLSREDFVFLLQQGDAARYRVSGKVLSRVSALFAGRSLPQSRKGSSAPALSSEIQTRLDLWLVAVNEALTGVPVTHAAETRAYRGARLLAAIEAAGADATFISFHREEADAPDLGPALGCDAGVRVRVDARKARADRRKAEDRGQANDARREVRAKRAAGEAPASVPRKTVKATPPADAPPVTAPVTPSAPDPERPDPVALARALAILSTPEARAEAKALGWYWQPGLDFPLTQAGRIARLFLRAEFAVRFPLLHEADILLGRPYRKNVTLLAKLLGVTKENLSGNERLTPHPCIDLDLAEGCALVLGKSLAFAVEGGRLQGLVEDLREDRERMLAQANKARDAWRERQKKLARAAARPRPEPPIPATHCEVRRTALGVYERVED